MKGLSTMQVCPQIFNKVRPPHKLVARGWGGEEFNCEDFTQELTTQVFGGGFCIVHAGKVN